MAPMRGQEVASQKNTNTRVGDLAQWPWVWSSALGEKNYIYKKKNTNSTIIARFSCPCSHMCINFPYWLSCADCGSIAELDYCKPMAMPECRAQRTFAVACPPESLVPLIVPCTGCGQEDKGVGSRPVACFSPGGESKALELGILDGECSSSDARHPWTRGPLD